MNKTKADGQWPKQQRNKWNRWSADSTTIPCTNATWTAPKQKRLDSRSYLVSLIGQPHQGGVITKCWNAGDTTIVNSGCSKYPGRTTFTISNIIAVACIVDKVGFQLPCLYLLQYLPWKSTMTVRPCRQWRPHRNKMAWQQHRRTAKGGAREEKTMERYLSESGHWTLLVVRRRAFHPPKLCSTSNLARSSATQTCQPFSSQKDSSRPISSSSQHTANIEKMANMCTLASVNWLELAACHAACLAGTGRSWYLTKCAATAPLAVAASSAFQDRKCNKQLLYCRWNPNTGHRFTRLFVSTEIIGPCCM